MKFKMKWGPVVLFFIVYIWAYSIFNAVNASENYSKTGVCESSSSLEYIELESYNELFFNVKKRKDRMGALYSKNEWYEGVYSTLDTWTGALENCAGGDKAECQLIVDHITFLSEQKKALHNWSGREDWNYIWESTFWNNTSLNVVLYAYKIANEQIDIDADTHSQIGNWAKKAVKSNKNFHLASVNKTFNNHQVQWARANALYGLIWNDSKALKVSHKALKRYLKSITKEGALKDEAVRGSRGLFYTGRTFLALFSLSELLNEAGLDVYNENYKTKINKAVNFYIDASADNTLIYKWSKRKKNNNGDPKDQEQGTTSNAWVGVYLNIDNIADKETRSRLYESETIQDYFFDMLGLDAGFWEVLDSECFYPVYRTGEMPL